MKKNAAESPAACCWQGCSSISRCVIGPGAILLDCGLISCSKPRTPTHRGCRFANGLAVKVGPETGGRELACYVTMRLAEAAVAVTDRSSSRAVAEQRVEVDAYAELARYNPHFYVCMYVCMYVCVFIKLHMIAQSGPVILVILCHSH